MFVFVFPPNKLDAGAEFDTADPKIFGVTSVLFAAPPNKLDDAVGLIWAPKIGVDCCCVVEVVDAPKAGVAF